MSIVFMDGFEQYGDGNVDDDAAMLRMEDGLYAAMTACYPWPSSTGGGPAARTGSFTLVTDGGFTQMRKVLPAAVASVGVGMAYYFPNLSNDEPCPLISMRDGSNTNHVIFVANSAGYIEVWRGNTWQTGTKIAQTSGPVVTAHAWNHIEMFATIHDTLGVVKVAVNNVTQINASALDTANTASLVVAQVAVQFTDIDSAPSVPNFYMDDLFIYDTSGSINNTFPIGDYRVHTLRPTSDITEDWTRSSGADSFALVDEATPNDADHLTAEDASDVVELGLENLPAPTASVIACMTHTRQLKTDSGTSKTQVALVNDGSANSGADRPLTTMATYYVDVIELDPDGDIAWTPAAVNSTSLRVTRTT